MLRAVAFGGELHHGEAAKTRAVVWPKQTSALSASLLSVRSTLRAAVPLTGGGALVLLLLVPPPYARAARARATAVPPRVAFVAPLPGRGSGRRSHPCSASEWTVGVVPPRPPRLL
eukprot:6189258-Pleurochrysis_carterae.AAC.2